MKKSLYSQPDPFGVSPLLAMLEVKGDINELAAMTPSFYARYEKMQSIESALEVDSEMHKRILAEKVMLKQLLEHNSVIVDETEYSTAVLDEVE